MVNFKKIPNDGVKFNQKEFYEDNFDLAALEFEKKVDKVTGKVLSTNDYTTLEKTKLSKVPDDTNASLSALTTDVNAQLAETGQRIDNIVTTPVPTGEIIAQEIIDARQGALSVGANISEVKSQVAETTTEVNKHFMKPYFIEYFASFNRFGLGQPSGIANYIGGNYVLGVSGNAGDSFLMVTSGNIEDGGGKWACVLKNDDGLYDINKVISHDGANKITLYSPLKKNISNGILANLHDSVQGQHYTEHGYFAFIQHLYFSNPRYCERNQVLAQFLPTDTNGKWVSNSGSIAYNSNANMNDADDVYITIGSRYYAAYMSDATKYVEWEENLNGYKGYIESFIGSTAGKSKVEFFLDDILVDTKEVSKPLQRIVFSFEYAKKGKIRISVIEGYPYSIRIGRTTWFANEKYSKEKLISPSDKVVYMGDSWGEFHNKAVTRELDRLMKADGGSPIIFNYSKGGHSSDYAKAWFEEYVIKNKPDKVIIEYFTNDFNSIRGTVLPTFTAPDGTQQDMNIASLSEYVSNIQWMIDKAIENGIQPIVVMPASTNSLTQAQAAADYTNQIWNGTKITNDTPYFAQATMGSAVTNLVEANGENDLSIKAKSANSAVRKGVQIDSDRNLTGGDIAGIYNNGVRKVGFKHNGNVELVGTQFTPQQFYIAADANGRAVLYLLEQSGVDDILYLNIRKADGSYARKKVQLID